MGYKLATIFAITALFLACTSSNDSTPTPLPIATVAPAPTAVPTPATTTTATPVPTPTRTAMPTEEPTPTPLPTDKPITTVTPTRRATPSRTPTPTPIDPNRFDPRIVEYEFPDEVDESIQLASFIANSSVIAAAKLMSIQSTVSPLISSELGYEAALLYRFEVIQYLMGGDESENELTVRVGSGPASSASDVFHHRSMEDAEKLSKEMQSSANSQTEYEKEAVLFLQSSVGRTDYSFPAVESNRYGDSPVTGETWLPVIAESKHQLNIPEISASSITLEELKEFIGIVVSEGNESYARCIAGALDYRERVWSQLLGTYREMTHTGDYVESRPFARREVTFESWVATDTDIFIASNPPYRTPRFSHYWLDGRDKDLFEFYVWDDLTHSTQVLVNKERLGKGEYIVLFNSYHESLPCDAPRSEQHTWWSKNTTEWIIRVGSP